jgi:hypothetical protein
LFRVSEHTVSNWRRAGRLRPFKVGQRWLFAPEEVAELLRGGPEKAPLLQPGRRLVPVPPGVLDMIRRAAEKER